MSHQMNALFVNWLLLAATDEGVLLFQFLATREAIRSQIPKPEQPHFLQLNLGMRTGLCRREVDPEGLRGAVASAFGVLLLVHRLLLVTRMIAFCTHSTTSLRLTLDAFLAGIQAELHCTGSRLDWLHACLRIAEHQQPYCPRRQRVVYQQSKCLPMRR